MGWRDDDGYVMPMTAWLMFAVLVLMTFLWEGGQLLNQTRHAAEVAHRGIALGRGPGAARSRSPATCCEGLLARSVGNVALAGTEEGGTVATMVDEQ